VEKRASKISGLTGRKCMIFLLSVSNENSGKVDQKLTMDEKGNQKNKEVAADKSATFFLPE
jgi:hypothetical protein